MIDSMFPFANSPALSRRRTLPALAAVFLFALVACPAPAQAEDWAKKMFKKTSHDFRTVGRGTKSVYHFEFTNLYEEDVHVSAVRSSCGCTTPTVSKKTLKTHEKASIVATFNTSTFVGQKSAVVTVVFDQPFYAEVQLKVSGFIRTDVTFDPPEVAFGEVVPGAGTQQDILITYAGSKPWQITDVRSHCEHLQVQLSPPQKTAGQIRYRMRVNILGTMPEGDVRERLTVISNDQEFPTTELSINGRVRPSLSLSPAALSLGSVKPSSTAEKRIVVKADEPFRITDVVCADKRFEFVTPEEPKKLHFMKVRFNAGVTPDRIAQEIRIKTDLKGGKSVSCIVTGSVGS